MSKRKILIWQIVAVFFSIIFGSILHFTYELSNNSKIIATFSAVNESTWEHLKLVFFPILIFSVIEYFFVKSYANNYSKSKFIAVIISILFILVTFYTYTGIFGANFFLIDILIFIFSIIISEYIAYKIMTKEDESNNVTNIVLIILTIILLLCFIVFTYTPPKIPLFKDPIHEDYGIVDME